MPFHVPLKRAWMTSVTSMLASRPTATWTSRPSIASERAAPGVATAQTSASAATTDALRRAGSEVDLRGLALALTRQLEELARREAEGARDEIRRELRDARVQVANDRVVVAARVLDRVLDLPEARLELREALRGAELRVRFREREHLAERARELALRLGLRRGTGRAHGLVARLDHGLERAALVAGVSLHGLHQVRDEVVAPLQLDVDVGPRIVGLDAEAHEAVVDDDDPDDDGRDDEEDDHPLL